MKRANVEERIDAMANAGELGPIAMRLAIEAGLDWPSLSGDEQDAWHERAIEKVRADLSAPTRPRRSRR